MEIWIWRVRAIIVFLWVESSIVTGGNERDELALLDFKAKISKDPHGILRSWNSSANFCQWYGVTCGQKHQRVTALNLNSHLLQGSISPYLGNLSFLSVLDLHNNSFRHGIPQELGFLYRVHTLDLSNNLLIGEIPANISACSNLISLDLGHNQLVGKIPEEFSSLSKLNFLILQFNNLTGGIPPFLGNLTSLELLGTNYNNFGGSLPDSLGRLKNLSYVSMAQNMLSGVVPPSIYNLSFMSVFRVPENKLEGTIPSNLGNISPSLVEFNIGDNLFTGSIPASLSNASNLQRFTIAQNFITGAMPSLEKLQKLWWVSMSNNFIGTGGDGDLNFLSTLNNQTSLELLAIHYNNFSGLLPDSVTNFTSLSIMTLNDNQIYGGIPAGVGNLVNLEMLSLGDNHFEGHIPEEIGNLKNLRKLTLHRNRLSGKIPTSLGNLTLLVYLHLNQNNLFGSVPPSLGKCQNLLSLALYRNNLSGPIPKEVMSIPSLAILLSLSQNYLIGSIPTEVGSLSNLGRLELNGNKLTGEIPSSLGSCQSMEFLYMEGNFLQGTIPSSLRSLKAIQVFDVSRNKLTGTIPEFFQEFSSLQRLNLSFNDLEGKVPSNGVFKNASATSIKGNDKLCGGIAEFQLPECKFEEAKEGTLKLYMKLIIAAAGALCIVLVLFSLFFLLVKRKRGEPNSSSRLSLENSPFLISYQSLLKATEGFSSSNLIGAGSFGSVYKGILDSDGMNIAVKVLNLFQPGASSSFNAECEVLRNVRHRNLVKLITSCSSVDQQGNDFKALIYEFMINGSLDDWLYPMDITGELHKSARSLKFLQRLSIAIDVANAIEYLHHGYETPIIHCDLKPSNVLLNEEMVAHLGDFGLARFLQETTSNNSCYQSRNIGVRGSIGYTAPEYGMGNETSMYGDVYSYGILLLEIFTGMRPTDEGFGDGVNLHHYAKAALPDQVEKILQPSLLKEIKEKSTMERYVIRECIISIFEIGVACSAEVPSQRMNISDVAAKLQTIKRNLPKSLQHGEKISRKAAAIEPLKKIDPRK